MQGGTVAADDSSEGMRVAPMQMLLPAVREAVAAQLQAHVREEVQTARDSLPFDLPVTEAAMPSHDKLDTSQTELLAKAAELLPALLGQADSSAHVCADELAGTVSQVSEEGLVHNSLADMVSALPDEAASLPPPRWITLGEDPNRYLMPWDPPLLGVGPGKLPRRSHMECLRSFTDAAADVPLPRGYADLEEIPSCCDKLSRGDHLLLRSDYDTSPSTTDLVDHRHVDHTGSALWPFWRRRYGPPICEMRERGQHEWEQVLQKFCLPCQAWCDADHAQSWRHQTALADYSNTDAGWGRWSTSEWAWLSKYLGNQGR